ncbi:MAG: LacI family DNA-binding transcriptional regulator [Firmicutes bacterium]|nr:LacI family DNA-binding transcriptional regulator [Bacillota bacterium]
MKIATIKDIAKEVGVSTATVSYVLNNTRQVSPATREKVLEAVARLGYTPNTLARGLVGKKTRSLAVAVTTSFCWNGSEAALTGILQGIGSATYAADYSFMLLFIDELSSQVLQELAGKGIEGLITVGLTLPKENQDTSPFPVVALDFGFDETPDVAGIKKVSFSYRQAFQLAASHLAELGKERITVIGPAYCQRGLADIARTVGVKMTYLPGEPTAPGGYVAVDALLSDSPPEAVITYNDSMAIGVLHALARRGYQVPEDMAVIGCNDDPAASYSKPPLTTLRIPWSKLGESAVKLFLGAETHYSIEPKLVIRESCGSSLWI